MNPYERIIMLPTTEQLFDRAVEIATEQKQRFDNFKKFYRVTDSHSDVLAAFYSEPSEAEYALLLQDYFLQIDKRRKDALTK